MKLASKAAQPIARAARESASSGDGVRLPSCASPCVADRERPASRPCKYRSRGTAASFLIQRRGAGPWDVRRSGVLDRAETAPAGARSLLVCGQYAERPVEQARHRLRRMLGDVRSKSRCERCRSHPTPDLELMNRRASSCRQRSAGSVSAPEVRALRRYRRRGFLGELPSGAARAQRARVERCRRGRGRGGGLRGDYSPCGSRFLALPSVNIPVTGSEPQAPFSPPRNARGSEVAT